MVIFIHSDESDQYQFDDVCDATNYIEELIKGSPDENLTITVYVDVQT